MNATRSRPLSFHGVFVHMVELIVLFHFMVLRGVVLHSLKGICIFVVRLKPLLFLDNCFSTVYSPFCVLYYCRLTWVLFLCHIFYSFTVLTGALWGLKVLHLQIKKHLSETLLSHQSSPKYVWGAVTVKLNAADGGSKTQRWRRDQRNSSLDVRQWNPTLKARPVKVFAGYTSILCSLLFL